MQFVVHVAFVGVCICSFAPDGEGVFCVHEPKLFCLCDAGDFAYAPVIVHVRSDDCAVECPCAECVYGLQGNMRSVNPQTQIDLCCLLYRVNHGNTSFIFEMVI